MQGEIAGPAQITATQQRNAADVLDENLYELTGIELEFFQRQTGIQDQDKLRQHILDVQKKAYAIYGYPCIRGFNFLRHKSRSVPGNVSQYYSNRLKISKLPAYGKALELGKRPGALFLDIGCCFGNDTRKIVEDGWPVGQAVASDLNPGFWDCGHDLFQDSKETFPATFIPGDAFDPELIAPRPPYYSDDPEAPRPRPHNIASLKTLTPLQGHFSAVHASSLFHLFNEEKQYLLAQQLATLLSPEPGSMIFGMHVALPEKGIRWEHEAQRLKGRNMFCHSPETWKEVWVGGGQDGKPGVFKADTVTVVAGLKKVERRSIASLDPAAPAAEFWVMWWSVTRK